MKESLFIKKNEQIWNSFESYLKDEIILTPDELADYYIHLTDDLSYARTFYPDSHVISYLNNLTVKAHTKIYSNKKEKKGRFVDFWKYEVPIAVAQSHKQLLYALIIFLVSIGIGMVSSIQDTEYVNLILGDSYVNMTLDNIDKGDPMAVYKSASQGNMFFGIARNNIQVSFIAFVVGIFGSVLSGLVLFYNGVMVGAFQWFFIKHGLFWISFSTIFIHGAIELSVIVIAGGAGIVLGNSLLFPGSYTRSYSLVRGARRSLKIIIGLVPFFTIAALLEAFVTRHYLEMGSWLRLSVIVLSFGLIIWYFIIYPLKIKKQSNEQFHN